MRQIIVLNKNASKKVGHNVSKTIDLESYLKNFLEGTKLLTTPLGNIVTTNLMRGTEQPSQVLFPIKTGGSKKFSVGIAHPLVVTVQVITTILFNQPLYTLTKQPDGVTVIGTTSPSIV